MKKFLSLFILLSLAMPIALNAGKKNNTNNDSTKTPKELSINHRTNRNSTATRLLKRLLRSYRERQSIIRSAIRTKTIANSTARKKKISALLSDAKRHSIVSVKAAHAVEKNKRRTMKPGPNHARKRLVF